MAIIADTAIGGNKRSSYSDRKSRLERTTNALQIEAARLGRTKSYFITINYKDHDETRDEALQWLVDAHGDEQPLYVGVDVSGSAAGAAHQRRPHLHVETYPPQNRIHQIWATKDARNAAVPPVEPGDGLSCDIRPIKDHANSQKCQKYQASKENLGRTGSEIFADKLTTKRAALWLIGQPSKTRGKARVSTPSLACAHGRAYSLPFQASQEALSAITPAIGQVAERSSPEERDATLCRFDGGPQKDARQVGHGADIISPPIYTATVADPETGEIIDTAAVVTIPATHQRQLTLLPITPNTIPAATFHGYISGIMPADFAKSARRAILDSSNEDGVAAEIGTCQGHLANALRGHDPLSAPVVTRLKAWLLTAPPTPRQPRKTGKSSHRRQADETPSLFALAA